MRAVPKFNPFQLLKKVCRFPISLFRPCTSGETIHFDHSIMLRWHYLVAVATTATVSYSVAMSDGGGGGGGGGAISSVIYRKQACWVAFVPVVFLLGDWWLAS